MAKLLKKHSFPLRMDRLFTREDIDAFELIHFRESEARESTFEVPDNWGSEAAALLAEHSASIPAATRAIEENTVPSWLWRRIPENRLRVAEHGARQIFHRLAGAATYAGWKQGVFADENETRIFFDEIRYMLAQRFIALEPRYVAARGLDWAYGFEHKPEDAEPTAPAFLKPVALHNTTIDDLLAGRKDAQSQWRKMLADGARKGVLAVRFADIAGDWDLGMPQPAVTRAALDLLAFRRDDGAIDAARLGHAVKLLVVLLELQPDRAGGSVAIGLHNLAPLLISQGLAYDSDAGRATAAALAAVVTAEAYAASGQLAALLGPSLDFAANRESVQRALRNHRRAAYGDRNDYEKISVLPQPLVLETGVDLALVAAARRRWDEVLDLVRQHGLRFTRLSDLTPAPELAFFMESASIGLAPMATLIAARAEGEREQPALHPAVSEGLAKLGYDAAARQTITRFIAGNGTLAWAPVIDHAALRRYGFDDKALAEIENYLPYVNDIRLAFTPWVLGDDFCRGVLNIRTAKFEQPGFDLLHELGFSADEITAANGFVYGRGTIRGAKGLKAAHAALFAAGDEISAEARLRMAAAVQGFISGDAGLQIAMPAPGEDSERLLLSAWRQGLKSIEIEWLAGAEETKAKAETKTATSSTRRTRPPATPLPNYKAPLHSALRSRAKASEQLVGLDQPARKSSSKKPKRPE